MTKTITTIMHAAALIGSRPRFVRELDGTAHAGEQITSCGVDNNGRTWIGFGHHTNDNGRVVVAPAVVILLPFVIEV
jgi:hypothetical protein